MVDIDLKSSQPELAGRLQNLMLLRLLFISVLLGASVFLQVRQAKTYFGDIQTTHFFLIAFVYFLTFVYILLFTTLKNYSRQAYIQLFIDSIFITAIIYSTGGIGSIFSFLYILNIINASIILYRKGGMIIASSCSILYGLLLDLHYYGVLQPPGNSWEYTSDYQASNIFYIILVNIAAFYIVAFLSSMPSEQARKSRAELKEIEKEIKKVEGLALVGELAAGIAHEIRNPLASISGSIQMLNEGLDTDEVNKRLMAIILREIDRLNHLINDFLKYARPKPFELREFDLNQLIIESLELLKNSGKWHSDIKLETNLETSEMLVSDAEQVRQVIWNVLLNAVDAIHEKGILFVGTKSVTSNNALEKELDMIEVTVRDSGDGFSERALENMFTPFFTTKEEGSGLGLAVVKQIVEGLKGRVYGRNHPDGGAEIRVLLKKQL